MKIVGQLEERLSEIHVRLVNLNADAAPIRKQLAEIDRERAKLQTEKTEIEKQILNLSKTPRVSDHAVILLLSPRNYL